MDNLRVSYSSLNTFASCARKFEFNKLYPRRDLGFEDFYAADVGKAMHAAYQNYLVESDKDKAIWILLQEFPFASEYSQSNDFRSFEACLSTLEMMMDEIKMNEYELVQIKTPSGEVKPAIEVPFEIRFTGLHINPCRRFPDGATLSMNGYIDAILRNVMTNQYRSMDIKTTRQSLVDATGKYKFDTQQVPYGIVIDHVAAEAVESFEVLYLDCYLDLLEPKVQLYPFMKRQQDIQEWAMNKLIQFQQLAKFLEADFFPRTDSGCLFYNKPCKYLQLCESRDPETIIEWLLLGEEPADDREKFEPWIIAEIEVGG